MKRKMISIVCLCLAAMSVSGCAKPIALTDEEQDIIAEYAARTLLDYDDGYNSRFKEDAMVEAKANAKKAKEEAVVKEEEKSEAPKKEETPTPTPTPTPAPTPTPMEEETPTPTPTPTPETPATESVTEEVTTTTPTPTKSPNKLSPYDIGKLFGVEGIEVVYTGYQALDMYPVLESDQLGFTMEANQGAKLVVVKFELVNKLEEPKPCNIVGQNIKFQMRFNGADYVGVQKTLLTDDFASLNCILQPGERKQVVVISQVAAGYENTINSIDLIARIGGENTMMNLQ